MSVLGSDALLVTGTVADLHPEQAERLRAERERQRIEALGDEMGARAVAALLNERAVSVQRFLERRPLDVTAMNAIGEMITADMGADRKKVVSNEQFKRFSRSINHPVSFGDQARHPETSDEPHPRAMGPDEAEHFIRMVAAEWLRWVAERESSRYGPIAAIPAPNPSV
jgi:hypothetical protein